MKTKSVRHEHTGVKEGRPEDCVEGGMRCWGLDPDGGVVIFEDPGAAEEWPW